MPGIGRDKVKKAHAEAMRTLNHPKFADLLADADENDQAREELRRDPVDTLRRKGIPVSEEADVAVREGSFCFEFRMWGALYRICF